MAQANMEQLVTMSLEKAGNVGLTDQAQEWISLVLDRLYASHPWPFLTQRYNIAAASSFVLRGATLAPVVQELRIYNVLRVQLVDGTRYVRELDIFDPASVPGSMDPNIDTASVGAPLIMLVDPAGPQTDTASDAWTCKLWPTPDKAYTLQVTLHAATEQLVYDDGTVTPSYPMDDTIVQGVYVEALRHQNDEREFAAHQEFERMCARDRTVHGKTAHRGRWNLARRAFGESRARKYNSRFGWMGD